MWAAPACSRVRVPHPGAAGGAPRPGAAGETSRLPKPSAAAMVPRLHITLWKTFGKFPSFF